MRGSATPDIKSKDNSFIGKVIAAKFKGDILHEKLRLQIEAKKELELQRQKDA